MSVFAIFLAMSQINFVLIGMVADLTVNAYTTTKFIRHKTYCPVKYRKFCEADLEMEHMNSAASETSVFTVSDSQDEDDNTQDQSIRGQKNKKASDDIV
jgi:hypothetical protein